MIFLSKRTIAFSVAAALIAAALFGGVAAAFMPAESTGFAVVIDAGHGGWDGGAVSADGVKESDIDLALALDLADKLERRGVAVVLTRSDDSALGETKREDMQQRARVIASSRAQCVVSLHLNSFPSQPSRRGAQVFYDDSGKGESLASAIQARLNASLNARYCGRSDFMPQAGDFFITKCSDLPSVIVECGFLSNAEDKALLTSHGYRNELCTILADTIYDILTAV